MQQERHFLWAQLPGQNVQSPREGHAELQESPHSEKPYGMASYQIALVSLVCKQFIGLSSNLSFSHEQWYQVGIALDQVPRILLMDIRVVSRVLLL